jgi:c-di-GMP-binding flagellar brake protein YcgR
MPVWFNGLTGLSAPLPSGSDTVLDRLAQGERWLWAFLFLAALLMIGLRAATGMRSRLAAARLRAYAAANVCSPDALGAGMTATLEISAPDGIQSLKGQIQAIDRKWIALSVPAKGECLPIAVGAPMKVTVIGDTAVYRFHAGLHDRQHDGHSLTLYVARPRWVEKIQRRQFFRIAVQLPVVISPADHPGGNITLHRGTIENLSGGGFSVSVSVPLAAGTTIRLRFPADTFSGLSFEARVVRCAPPARRSVPRTWYAQCEFIHLPEETRNLIVNYCFEMQRQHRKALAANERK